MDKCRWLMFLQGLWIYWNLVFFRNLIASRDLLEEDTFFTGERRTFV